MNRFHPVALIALVACIALTVVGCSTASPSVPSAPAAAPKAPAAAPQQGGSASSATDSATGGDRMVIRTAYLQMFVTDVQTTLDRITALTKEVGGYVVSSERQEQGGSPAGKASIRVPADRMDDAMQQLASMAKKVGRQTTSAKDVTEEYVDQDARLKAMKATEEQYIKLLNEAKNMEDILKIQQSIGQVRGQIEQTQGRLLYLQRSSETSVINVDILTEATAQPIQDGTFNAEATAYQAFQALVRMGTLLFALGIWVIVFAPVWVPIALIVRWQRRRNRPPVPPRSAPPAQPMGGPA